ncbi:MAG: hypothetical protein JJU00_04470 [Opitutales bacterium]|nr:hypothetical protein [Opitutales bacterium]
MSITSLYRSLLRCAGAAFRMPPRLSVAVAVMCLAAQETRSDSLLAEYDFEAPFAAFAAGAGVSGVLPDGWSDASAGDAVEVRYGELREAPFTGVQSLLMEVDSVAGGAAVLVSPVVDLTRGEVLRLRLALRSPTSAQVEIRLTGVEDAGDVRWASEVNAVPEWSMNTLLLAVPEGMETGQVVLAMSVPGRLETDAWTLEALDVEDLVGERDFETNLLGASSFPLGPTSPFVAAGNFRPDDAVVTDPEVTGPTGNPALRLTGFMSEGFTTVRFTGPFEARPNQDHTFSFWARGSEAVAPQSVTVQMGRPGQKHSRVITLTSAWERYSISAELPFSFAGAHLVRIVSGSQDPFWVDGLRVAQGEGETEFARSGPVELTAEATADSGLFFEGEAFTVDIALWGALEAAAGLEGSLRHADGRVFDMPFIAVAHREDVLHRISGFELPDTGAPEFGTFVLSLRVVDAVGAPLSKWSETLLHRVRTARYADRFAPHSPFGTHVFWTERETRRAKALGFNWVRGNYQLPWSGIEPEPGEWRWDLLDTRIAHPRNAKLEVLAYLSSAPRWASTARADWSGNNAGWWRFTAPPRGETEMIEAFGEYAYRVLERYGDDLTALETWNEPFLAAFFPDDVVDGAPLRAPPRRLYEMTQQVRAAADATGYGGRLFWNIGGHYGADERGFDEANLSMGTADLVDGYSLHRYSQLGMGFPGDQMEIDMEVIEEMYPEAGAAKPVWNSEGGVGPSEVFSLFRHNPPRNLAGRAGEQGRHFIRYHLSNLAAGIERVFSYAFFEQDRWSSEYSYMHVDGRLSHIASVFSNLAWHLEDREFDSYRNLDYGMNAFTFRAREHEGPDVAVVLASQQRTILTGVPEGLIVRDMYGNEPEVPAIIDSGILYVVSDDLDASFGGLAEAVVWSPQPSPFRQFADLGDSWRQTFLGRVNDAWWPWLEHESMGWLFARRAGPGQSLHLYDYRLRSWMFAPSPGFPWLYHHASESWCWFARDTSEPRRWFWFPGSGDTVGEWRSGQMLRE